MFTLALGRLGLLGSVFCAYYYLVKLVNLALQLFILYSSIVKSASCKCYKSNTYVSA